MTEVLHSFIHGWRTAARLWPLVAVVYLVDALFAGAMAAPLASRLAELFGHSTLAPELAGPVTLDWMIELQEGAGASPFPWALYLLAPAASALVTTFLRGGILGALARTGEAGLGPRRFLSDCVRHFWRFLLMLILAAAAFAAVLVASLLTLRIGGSGPGGGGLVLAPAIVRGVLLALLAFLLPAILDYARISLVLNPGRSLFRHLGRAVGFVVLRFPAVLLLGLGFWACAALIAGLWPAVLALLPGGPGFLAAFVPQQIAAALASWQRVAMLGGEMSLFATGRTWARDPQMSAD